MQHVSCSSAIFIPIKGIQSLLPSNKEDISNPTSSVYWADVPVGIEIDLALIFSLKKGDEDDPHVPFNIMGTMIDQPEPLIVVGTDEVLLKVLSNFKDVMVKVPKQTILHVEYLETEKNEDVNRLYLNVSDDENLVQYFLDISHNPPEWVN